MTGTDFFVKKLHCAAAVRPRESEATTSTYLLLGLEPVQSCLLVARVMTEQKVPRSVEQSIVIKFLIGENVPSAEIHHRLQQQYEEECLSRTREFEWCKCFREGRERVENEPHDRRPLTSITEPNTDRADALIFLRLSGGYPCGLSDRCQKSQCSLLLRPPGNRREGKDPIQAEDREKAGSLPSR
jgi:hypothetical protein